jgi:hypothetical protein
MYHPTSIADWSRHDYTPLPLKYSEVDQNSFNSRNTGAPQQRNSHYPEHYDQPSQRPFLPEDRQIGQHPTPSGPPPSYNQAWSKGAGALPVQQTRPPQSHAMSSQAHNYACPSPYSLNYELQNYDALTGRFLHGPPDSVFLNSLWPPETYVSGNRPDPGRNNAVGVSRLAGQQHSFSHQTPARPTRGTGFTPSGGGGRGGGREGGGGGSYDISPEGFHNVMSHAPSHGPRYESGEETPAGGDGGDGSCFDLDGLSGILDSCYAHILSQIPSSPVPKECGCCCEGDCGCGGGGGCGGCGGGGL